MSYFDLPRLHVSGRFFADPSSVNNDPDHYLPETTRPSPWQTPHGKHHFRFEDCRLMSAIDLDGNPVEDGSVVGLSVQTTNKPSAAKIVDLDVYQQAVTMLFGAEILIGDESGHYIKGMLDPPVQNGNSFNFVQPTRGWKYQYGYGSYGGDSNAIGGFQNVIRVPLDHWTFPDTSFFGALKEQCQIVTEDGQRFALLAFHFLLDGYWNVQGTTDFQYGRITGAIGPLKAGDPHETPGSRWLHARALPDDAEWYVPFFYRAPFHLDKVRNRLLVDWSGSISRVSVGGDPVPLDHVEARVKTSQGSVTLGRLRVDAQIYGMNGGISELSLTKEQTEALTSNPLEIWTSREDIGSQKIFWEADDGMVCRTQNRSIRMAYNPPISRARPSTTARAVDPSSNLFNDRSTASATIHITKFGEPQAGVTPKLKIIAIKGDTPGITVPPNRYPGDTLDADGALEATVTPSDADGFSRVTFSAVKDPGFRTPELDGQIYFCYAYLGDEEPWKEPVQEQQISVLLWSDYEVIEEPSWEDIRKLMAPYAKLYPGMTDKFNLADKTAFDFYSNNPGAPFFVGPDHKFDIPGHPDIQNGTIPFYISLPVDDPRYMPVTRDLSPNKIETMLNYIGNEQKKIQAALEKEEKATKGEKS
ncbi:MAG: hypothetical protein ACRBM6_01705 [Geminicoccales bacterium]